MFFIVRAAPYKKGAIYVTDRIHKRWIHNLDELARIQKQCANMGWPGDVQEWVPAELEAIPTVGVEPAG